jgi:ketosteroid isomerase-like protein
MQTPAEVVQTWVEAFNAADVGALAALYAEDATNHQVVQDTRFRLVPSYSSQLSESMTDPMHAPRRSRRCTTTRSESSYAT